MFHASWQVHSRGDHDHQNIHMFTSKVWIRLYSYLVFQWTFNFPIIPNDRCSLNTYLWYVAISESFLLSLKTQTFTQKKRNNRKYCWGTTPFSWWRWRVVNPSSWFTKWRRTRPTLAAERTACERLSTAGAKNNPSVLRADSSAACSIAHQKNEMISVTFLLFQKTTVSAALIIGEKKKEREREGEINRPSLWITTWGIFFVGTQSQNSSQATLRPDAKSAIDALPEGGRISPQTLPVITELPSRKLRYPPDKAYLSRWFSFSPAGIC